MEATFLSLLEKVKSISKALSVVMEAPKTVALQTKSCFNKLMF